VQTSHTCYLTVLSQLRVRTQSELGSQIENQEISPGKTGCDSEYFIEPMPRYNRLNAGVFYFGSPCIRGVGVGRSCGRLLHVIRWCWGWGHPREFLNNEYDSSACRFVGAVKALFFILSFITAEAKLRRQYRNAVFLLLFIFFFFFSVFRRTPPHNLRKPSSSHFQGLKIEPFPKRSFSPFDPNLKTVVGAPPQREGGKTTFWLHNSAIFESI
jgi:hypothetical protein